MKLIPTESDRRLLHKYLTRDLQELIPVLLALRSDVLEGKEGAEAAEAAYIAAGKARMDGLKAFVDACINWSCDDCTLGELGYRLYAFREQEYVLARRNGGD